jgi:ABC-type antimicrobial peptide transport system permease subunit
MLPSLHSFLRSKILIGWESLDQFLAAMWSINVLLIKILVNRLVLPGLDSIVSNSQTAFVPNRSVSENVLLTQELVRDYTKDKGELDAHPK